MSTTGTVVIDGNFAPFLEEAKAMGARTAQEMTDIAVKLKRESDKAAKEAAASVRKAAKEADAAAKKTADAAEKAARALNERVEQSAAATAKAVALTGDAFGSWAGPIGDIGDAFQLMDAKTAAAVVGFGLAVSGLAAIAATGMEVIRNVDEYSDKLGENEAAIRGASAALAAMDDHMQRQAVTIAGQMAPAVETLSYAYVGMTDNIQRATEYLADTGLGQWLIENSAIIAYLEGQAERGRRIASQRGVMGEQFNMEADANAGADAAAQDLLAPGPDAERAYAEAARRAEAAAQEAARRRLDAERAAAAEREAYLSDHMASVVEGIGGGLESIGLEVMGLQDDIAAGLGSAFDALGEYITAAGDFAAREQQLRFDAMLEQARAYEAELAALADERAAREAEQRIAAQEQQSETTATAVSSFAQSVQTGLGLLSRMYDGNTKAGKKAIRDLAVAQKAAAIFDIAIKTAQAIMAALTIPPPAGTVAAVAAGALGAVQAAAVAAQPLPSHHAGRYAQALAAGRMASDESPAMLRRGEVVVPAPTVVAAGGPEAVRDRLRGGAAPSINVRIDLSDRTIRAPLARDMSREMASPWTLGWSS